MSIYPKVKSLYFTQALKNGYMTYPIKIIIADNLKFYRDGLKQMVQNQKLKQIKVVGEACNGLELLDQIKIHTPHVIVTDIHIESISQRDLINFIADNYSTTGIIFLTSIDDEENWYDAPKIFAIGYLLKDASNEEVIEAITKVSNGSSYLCKYISSKIIQKWSKSPNIHFKKKSVHFTEQEIKVIKLICQQRTTKEIADYLSLCTRTVDDYRQQILEKIGAKNVVGIVLHALKNQIISFSELDSIKA